MSCSPYILTWAVLTILASPFALHAQPDMAPPADAAEEAAPGATEEEAFQAMGYAMAGALNLNVGFTAAELELIFEGMRASASGEGRPANYEAAVERAQAIFMSKMQAKMVEEQAKAAEVAQANRAAAEAYFAELEGKEGIQKTESGLYYEILEPGEGKQPTVADNAVVNYTGTLIDGTEFDSGTGATFPLARVVPGFSEGLQLLKEGGKARLYLTPDLGYGDQPAAPGSAIQPGSALIFDVELVEVREAVRRPAAPPPSAAPRQLPEGIPPPPSGQPPTPPPNYRPSPPSEVPGPPPGGN